MASFMYNISKGRQAEFFYRVANNDPAASGIIVIPLSASGTEAEGQDYDTVSAVLGGTADERTSGGWGRKTLTDSSSPAIAAPSPDDSNNRFACLLPALTWTTPSASNNTTGLLVAYFSNTANADNNALSLPICHLDFAITTDGNDVVTTAVDIIRATS